MKKKKKKTYKLLYIYERTQVFLLATIMINIGLVKPTEKTWSWWIAVMVAAQPGVDPQCIQSSAGEDGLHLVQQLKAAHEQNLVG